MLIQMIDYILFAGISLSFAFVILSVIFMWREKEFEDKRLKGSVNVLLLGLVFLAIFLLSKSVEYGMKLFGGSDISYYATVIEIVCISLMIIFFLVGMILMREI